MLIFLDGKVLYFKILIIKVSLYATPAGKFTRRRLYLHTQFYRVCWNAMIRIHGKRVLTVLAFVMAICVSFQLGLIWSTRSSFSDIVREQLDVENHVQPTQLRELKMNHTTTSTSQTHHKSFLITRRSCMQHYDLLMIISSAPGNFERRNNIRKTWAFERSAKPRWTSVFLVAQTRNEAVSNVLLDEVALCWLSLCKHGPS